MHKNIVLLSDGTGNSAAKPFKTNVWRLYQALDIAEPESGEPAQLVHYDDGVGSENFKPLAALGGALGLGVWRNVKELYTFVCRNYAIGDQIFAFGFSRGAFTVRLLMGLIGKCGIARPRAAEKAKPFSEAELLEVVQMAYEAYRRDFLIRASKERWMIYHRLLGRPKYQIDEVTGKETAAIELPPDIAYQEWPDIPFVGVWDTVDAYGMPIDELKSAIDRWIWPMSFADRKLSDRIRRARHALSLDDERPTFRPVLWHELDENERPLGASRIQQVWFAGVHANVGGGYPDDGLAYATLKWMMTEAREAGLRFDKAACEAICLRADPHGKQYDSRSGIAGYYRYGPRQVRELCNDPVHGVVLPVVRVDAGVVERIAKHEVGYAPISINCSVSISGGPDAGKTLAPDPEALEAAWSFVVLRRAAYLATVGLTLYVAWYFLPQIELVLETVVDWLDEPFEPLVKLFAHVIWYATWPIHLAWMAIARVAEELALWIPDGVIQSGIELKRTIKLVATSPWTLLAALAMLLALFARLSNALQARVSACAERAWASVKGLDPSPPVPAMVLVRMVRPLRRKRLAAVYRFVVGTLVVNVLGIVLGLLLYFPIALVGLWLSLVRPRRWLASKQKR